MTEYVLSQWSVHPACDDPYQPPESGIRLGGYRDDEQRRVITSLVASVDGRRITTQSGSVYVLAEPNPAYVEYLHSIGQELDPERPIVDRRHP